METNTISRKVVTRAIVQRDGGIVYVGEYMNGVRAVAEAFPGDPIYARALRWAKEHPELQFDTPEGKAARNKEMFVHLVSVGDIKYGDTIYVSDGPDSEPYPFVVRSWKQGE